MKRILASIGLALIGLLLASPFVLAVPSSVANLTANPSDTYIMLRWDMATGSNSTVIRYRTDTYPTTSADGQSAYNGTSYSCNVSGLTAGQIYFFAAWGYDGSSYSANSTTIAMSTLAVAIPSGGQDENTVTLPTVPATLISGLNPTPNPTAFNLEPFTSMVKYFVNAPGGLGVPEANLWEVLAILGIVGSGFFTYIRIRNFFVAFAVLFVVTIFFVGLHLVQGWLVGVELVIGAGVWAIDHYLQ